MVRAWKRFQATRGRPGRERPGSCGGCVRSEVRAVDNRTAASCDSASWFRPPHTCLGRSSAATPPSAFQSDCVAAVEQVIDRAERLLGSAWPCRQFERKGWWPGEFNLLAYHAAALPRFLSLVMQLETVAEEPTFATVLRGLKRGVTSADWRHALLQLEVGHARRGPAVPRGNHLPCSRRRRPGMGGVRTPALAGADHA